MSLRTGLLRIATVIRGVGWLALLVSASIGVASGVSEGWQYPDRWEDPPTVGSTQQGSAHPADRYKLDTAVFVEKEFGLSNVRFGYMLAGLAVGAVLLGLAYVAAWVLAGFAPGT